MRYTKAILVVLILIGAALAAHADGPWRKIGPGAGSISLIVPDRNHPELWYAVNLGALYRSKDGGFTWKFASVSNVTSVVVHPATSEVLVASGTPNAATSRVYQSRDQGATFGVIANLNFPLRKIFIHPTNPGIVYGFGLGVNDLAVSSDGGRHWTAVANLPFVINQPFEDVEGCTTTRYRFRDLLFSPFDPQTFYTSTEVEAACCPGESLFEDVLLVSHNAGRTWDIADRENPQDINEYNLASFHVDPLFQRAFLINQDGIQALTSTGFKPISTVKAQQMVSVPRKPNLLFALNFSPDTGSKILQSKDGGRNWKELSLDLANSIRILATADTQAGGLFAGTDGAGLFFRDDLQGWRPMNTGFLESRIVSLDTQGDGTVLAVSADESAYYPRFLYGTENSGQSWRNMSFQLPQFNALKAIGTVNVNPLNPKNIILSGWEMLRVSQDGGKTWKAAGTSIFFRAFDPHNASIVYFMKDSKVYRSTQGGLNPQPLSLQLKAVQYINGIFIDPSNSQTMYFLTDKGVFRSRDGGKTAGEINSGLCSSCVLDARSMASLSQPNSFLLVLSSGDIYRTNNGGDTWEKIAKVKAFTTDIRAADSTGQHFYLISGYLHESLDGGRTWKSIGGQFGGKASVYDMTDPRVHPFYVGTTRGVFAHN